MDSCERSYVTPHYVFKGPIDGASDLVTVKLLSLPEFLAPPINTGNYSIERYSLVFESLICLAV